MSDRNTERFEHMSAAVDAIGRLMGTYEKDTPAQVELEKYRRAIMGVVFGETTGVDLGGETNELYRDALSSVAEGRIARALKNMKTADAVADLLADSAMLQKLAGK